jgi:hypothetical protein
VLIYSFFYIRNHFNFLTLNKIFELKDESIFLNLKTFDSINNGDLNENKKIIKGTGGDSLVDTINVYIFETSFPLLTTISIIIVLMFLAYQIIKLRKILRLKKFRKNFFLNKEKFTR